MERRTGDERFIDPALASLTREEDLADHADAPAPASTSAELELIEEEERP